MTVTSTHVIRIHEYGGRDALRYERVELGEPGPGQVLLRQTAVGVNFIDTYHRTGLYPLPSLPHGLGTEAAGVIEAVGEGVSAWRPGQRVGYAGGTPGAYAEARVMGTERLVALPDDVDDETAAAVLLKGLTVEYLVRRTFRVESGMAVLLHAAAGGTGLLACQWLHHLGARVIGTVGTDEKAELARAHGCDHPIVYTREDFVERVRELTDGNGVAVVYDSVGKATVHRSLECLSSRGMMVAFGNASGAAEPIDPLDLLRHGSLFFTRPSMFDYTATAEELAESAAALFEALQSGAVKGRASQRWPLAETAAAHEALEGRRTTGSTVLVP